MTSTKPESLYHVIFTISHLQRDPTSEIEKVRIPGTYVSLAQAKAAAHSCLFDAGYEKEWFSTYETQPERLESLAGTQGTGLAVFAVATDGTIFRVRVATTPNVPQLTTDLDDGRIRLDLYHVVQSTHKYDSKGDVARDMNIQGTFETYTQARNFATGVLLSEQDGLTKESYVDYNEAGPNDRDCGYGENVIVYAAGSGGQNYLVSVIKSQGLESVRLAEASMRIKWTESV